MPERRPEHLRANAPGDDVTLANSGSGNAATVPCESGVAPRIFEVEPTHIVEVDPKHVTVETDSEDDATADASAMPRMRVSEDLLDKLSQSHASALTAFGDLIDNARESQAKLLHIDIRTHPRPAEIDRRRTTLADQMLVLEDDGRGMSEGIVRMGLGSIGHTSKSLSGGSGLHYGFGSKTALPKLAEFCLIFTRSEGGHRTVALLSSSFSISLLSSFT